MYLYIENEVKKTNIEIVDNDDDDDDDDGDDLK